MNRIRLKFIWSEKNLGVSLDQRIGPDRFSFLERYIFWPQNDPWGEVQRFGELTNWIEHKESFVLLNRLTEIMNFWQVNCFNKRKVQLKDIQSLQSQFPECSFLR